MTEDQQDDQTPAAPREKPHWRMTGREKLLWMRAQREARNRLIGVRHPKVDDDPEVEAAIREQRCVTGPYDPFK